MLRFARSFGAGFALVVLGFLTAFAAQLPLPAVNGPYLGDQLNNLYAITNAYIQGSGHGLHAGLSVSQTATQAACTQLDSNVFQEVKTSAGTGSVCLPAAVSGKFIFIGNAAGQTIDLFGSATPFVSGTQDTINGTAGTSAYTGVTTGKSAICWAPANGAWYCGAIS